MRPEPFSPAGLGVSPDGYGPVVTSLSGVSLAHTYTELGPDWDEFVGQHRFAARTWLGFTETVFADYDPIYVTVRRDGRIVGAAVTARQRHLNIPAYLSGERRQRLANRAAFRLPPLSVQVSPFGIPGVIVAPDDPDPDRSTDAVLAALERVERRTRSPFIGVNALPADSEVYRRRGYSFFETAPDAIIDLPAGVYDDYRAYEQGLPKKHREEVRRVRNRAFRAGVKVEHLRAGQLPADELPGLMHAVYARHGSSFPYDPSYVEFGQRFLADDDFAMVTARLDERLIACVAVFRSGTHGAVRWIGLDYELAHEAHAYHLVMSESIGLALDLGVRTLALGTTNYTAKKKLGATLEPRWIAARPFSRTAGRTLQRVLALRETHSNDETA